MKKPNIQFAKDHPEAQLPVYKTAEAAGADVCAVEAAVLAPGQRAIISTGLKCSIPPGWEIQVRCRSGLAANHGITIPNGPGTVDSDYTGVLRVILLNTGNEDFAIAPGDRIAQLVIAPVWQADFSWAEELRETSRGAGGFGSTGRSG